MKRTYKVTARKEGYAPVVSELITLEDERDTAQIVIRMAKGKKIKGVVVDEYDDPIAEAEISCTPYGNRGSVYLLDQQAQHRKTIKTDTEGYFEVENLDPEAAHSVRASAEGYEREQQEEYLYGTEGVYPGGEEITIKLKRVDAFSAGGSISGTVYVGNKKKKPVKKAAVYARLEAEDSEYPGGAGYATTDDSGNYIIEKLDEAGTYKVTARKEPFLGIGKRLVSGPVEVILNENEDRERVDLFLTEGYSAGGKVIEKETGKPIVWLKLFATPVDAEEYYQSRSKATTNSEGKFRISGLGQGLYSLKASSRTYATDVQSVKALMKQYGIKEKDTEESDFDPFAGGDIVTVGIIKVGGGFKAEGLQFTLEKGRSISGIVVDDSGNPVSRVVINLYRVVEGEHSYHKETKSGLDGRFELKGLPSVVETWNIDAEHDDYLETETDLQFQPTEIRKEITLTLPSGLSISGTVCGIDGEPIKGAGISSVDPHSMSYAFETDEADAKTDENGWYTLTGLEPDSYTLIAKKSGYAPSRKDNIVLTKYGLDNIDFILEPGLSISGRILFSDEEPLKNAQVVFVLSHDEKPSYSFNKTTNHNGEFKLEDIDNRLFDLTVRSGYGYTLWGEQQQNLTFEKTVPAVPAGNDDVVITLDPTGSVSGQVIDMITQSPITDFSISFRPRKSEYTSSYGPSSIDDSYYRGYGKPFHTEDGMFTLENMYPGEYIITAYSKSYVRNQAKVSILSGREAQFVVIQLSKGCRVSGRILRKSNSKPFQHASIKLEGEHPAAKGAAQSDRKGKFEMAGLIPGEYTLKVWVYSRRNYESFDQKIDITGDTDLGDIFLGEEDEAETTATAVLEGYVTTNAGAQVEAVWVSVIGAPRVKGGDIDDEGYYKFRNVPEGETEVQMHYHRNDSCAGRITKKIAIKAGEPNRLDFVIPEGATVKVTVTLNGKPVACEDIRLVDKEGNQITSERSVDNKYRFNCVPPGEYQLKISAFSHGREYPRQSKTEIDFSRQIVVGKTDLEVPIDIRTFLFSGMLYDRNGSPAVYKKLIVESGEAGKSAERSFYTDGNGEFAFYGTVAGSYKIFAYIDNRKIFLDSFHLRPGEEYKDIRLDLP